MTQHVAIIGAGQAAIQLIDTLQRKGHRGQITLVGDEPHLPYQRPPLSKKYLAGTLERDRLTIRHAAYFEEHGVSVLLGQRAVAIDRVAKQLTLDSGANLRYDSLVLATGSRARELSVPGAQLRGVHAVRNIADVDALRAHARHGARLVVIGGGYIGLEVAATCRDLGVEVTVLEMADRVMTRVVCEPVSRFFEAEHARHGVKMLTGARLEALVDDGSGKVRAARCADGSEYPADFVVVGVGVMAEDRLAAAAGLNCANGIVVDCENRTSDPNIWAIGDCCNQHSLHYNRRLRLESVDNAFEQGTTAALSILGTAVAHDPVQHNKIPWFWSDQYDIKLIIVGLSQEHDQVVLRGSPATRCFSACYLRGGELIAVDTINSAKDQMAARKLIATHARPDVSKLADIGISMKECV
jgi:3-phenylpropionate/trans-cinnamate dioxygenase ferredoxin reductase subunit